MENNENITENTEVKINAVAEEIDETLHKPGSYDPVKEAKGKIIWFVTVLILMIIGKYVFGM